MVLEHPLLRLLPDAAENRSRWNSMPKLEGSNNVGRFKPLAAPLWQCTVNLKTGADATADRVTPILGVIAVGDGKVVAAAVDSLWCLAVAARFRRPAADDAVGEHGPLPAPPPGRKPEQPHVALSDASPQVGQEVTLTTDLRDANFDPIRNAELVVTVARPDGSTLRILPRDLPEEPGHDAYRVPLRQPGPHRVTAKFGKFESSREFLAGAAGEFTDLASTSIACKRWSRRPTANW